MRRAFVVAASLIGAMLPVSGHAAIVPTAVTATGPYGNNLANINDGVFPPDYTPYNDASSVYYGSNAFAGGDGTTFTFLFGGLYSINQVLGAVDFNDDYVFTFFNGAVAVGSYAHGSGSGPVTFGLQNFAASIGPLTATSVVLTTANGDHLYGVGEAEFGGTAATAAVPEPVTWAMMICGFAMVGAVVRHRRRTRVSFA